MMELNNKNKFRVIGDVNAFVYKNKECFKIAINTKNTTVNLIQQNARYL